MKYHPYRIVFILFLQFIIGSNLGPIYASEPVREIIYVIKGDSDANNIVKIPWSSDLTVQDAVAITQSDPKYTCVLLSKNGAIVYGGRALLAPPSQADQIQPGDVIVMGVVDKKRGEKLDRIKEVSNRLGTKWNEYKNWMRRASNQTRTQLVKVTLLVPVEFTVTNFNPTKLIPAAAVKENPPGLNGFQAGFNGIIVDPAPNDVNVQILVGGTGSSTYQNAEASQWNIGWIQQMNSFDAQRIYTSSTRTLRSSASPPAPLMDCPAASLPLEPSTYAFTTNGSSVTPFFTDGPYDLGAPWNDPSNGNGNPIKNWHLNYSFTTWLVAYRNGTNSYVYLKNIQWAVQNTATINISRPVGQRVSLSGSANILSTGDGVGSVTPKLNAPSTNNVLAWPNY